MQYKVEFEPWLGTPFLGGLSHGSENLQNHGSGPLFWGGFEQWLRAPFLGGLSYGSVAPSTPKKVFLSHGSNPIIEPKNGVLSHGSNPQKRCSRAMAQTPQKRGPKPWLKHQKRGSRAMALKIFRAMAQTPKKWGPEPWLKLNFVLHILTSKNGKMLHILQMILSIPLYLLLFIDYF